MAILSRSKCQVEEVAGEIASSGGQAIPFVADVTDVSGHVPRLRGLAQ